VLSIPRAGRAHSRCLGPRHFAATAPSTVLRQNPAPWGGRTPAP
jgi:hypothetical protein